MEASALAAADATPWQVPHLPPPVVERILQFLPLSTRHSYALVSPLWAAAVTPATVAARAIVIDKVSTRKADFKPWQDRQGDSAIDTVLATGLEQWLHNHGDGITKLHLEDDSWDGFVLASLPGSLQAARS